MKIKSLLFAALTLAIHLETGYSQAIQPLAQDSEQDAIAKIRVALAVAERSFTIGNVAHALAVTEDSGGLDNEAAIMPWFSFLEKHHNKVFVVTDGKKDPGATGLRLYLVTSYCLENGLEIKDPVEAKKFKRATEKLGNIMDQ
jgi:hypothetical protein